MTTADITPFSLPGTADYAEATAAFQLAARVDPIGAHTARSVDDVVRAVATARRANLPLRLNGTGHSMGRTVPPTGSLLLRPLIDAPVRVDPATRTARVPAGKTWGEVLPEAVKHGLTALHGSSSTVGVIGYLLGGGLSFYGRRFGLAANSVRSLTVVTADGDVVETSLTHRPDLFWALRGGGGGFGVVVEAHIDLVPMHSIITGLAIWDGTDAARLAPVWQAWARSAPPEITTSLRMLRLPPLPTIPPVLAGKRVLALDGAITATTAADLPGARRSLDDMLAPLAAVAQPIMNTWAPASPQALPQTHMDPPQPVPFRSSSALINELDDAGWTKVLDAAPGLLALELRQLGGAFATPATDGGVVDRFAAPLLYYAVGVAGHDTDRNLTAIQSAFDPHLTGRTAPNFINNPRDPQRSYDEEVHHRVDRIRRATDPTGLFAGDVAPTIDRT